MIANKLAIFFLQKFKNKSELLEGISKKSSGKMKIKN